MKCKNKLWLDLYIDNIYLINSNKQLNKLIKLHICLPYKIYNHILLNKPICKKCENHKIKSYNIMSNLICHLNEDTFFIHSNLINKKEWDIIKEISDNLSNDNTYLKHGYCCSGNGIRFVKKDYFE